MSPAKKKTDPKADAEPPFEQRLARLEELVRGLESGELSLEQGVEQYREGVELLQGLQRSLDAAELQVEQLTEVLRRSLDELEGSENGEELDPDDR